MVKYCKVQIRRFLYLILICSFLFSCQTAKINKQKYSVNDYTNILNIQNVPQQPKDWSAFCFSDLGSWFGFALPDSSDKSHLGSFSGPFLMTHGKWLSQNLIKLNLYNPATNQNIGFSKNKRTEINYFPGRLSQKIYLDDLEILLELIFISNRTALIKTSILNKSTRTVTFQLSWTGNVFLSTASFENSRDKIIINFEDKKNAGLISFPFSTNKIDVISEKDYKVNFPNIINIEPDKKFKVYSAFSLLFNKNEKKSESMVIQKAFNHPDQAFNDNSTRWNDYLKNVLSVDTKWAQQREYQEIAVKALLTLINNWKCANNDLFHDGLFPSYAVWYFNGFWGWDSWKHSAALSKFAPELAKNQIRTMFDYQDEFGMIADCIYADKSENNWLDTKPPLAAWAVWRVYQEIKDKMFLKEMAQKLLKFHKWWYRFRDHDKNGLCEYGATQNKLIGAKWESGMDDGVRFDNGKMVQNRDKAWSINQESVDLNSYLYADKIHLASIFSVLGDEAKATEFKRDAAKLKSLIQTKMFNQDTGFFYDIRLADKTFIKVQGPEGWIPLWAGVATQEQANQVVIIMTDTSKFATYIPFPTVPKDHPEFMTGYWRGAVWFDQAYFGVKALERYGFQKEADLFTKQLFNRPEGLKSSNGPIRENYNPTDGKGMKVKHFSWSAAHLLMLFWGI